MPPSSGSEDNSRKLSPFVFWAQTESSIFLRICLQDVSEPEITTTSNSLEFLAPGIGANTGRNEYYFKFVFFKDIDTTIKVTKKPVEIHITVEKSDIEWWPRLTEVVTKPAWLKLDFDKMKTDDDDEEEEEKEENNEQFSSKYNEASRVLSSMKNRQRKYQKRVEDFRKIYLFLYNLSQFVGFLYVLIVLSLNYARDGPAFMGKAYSFVQIAFTFCQAFQVLEIVHPMLGYTGGSAFPPFLQVFGRLFMLVGMINAEPRIQSKPVVFYLLYVYCLSEVVRYPYYMLRVYNANSGFLTWLRYTIWIPLYPLGFLCEGIIILRNIPYFEETKRFCVFLPNALNISIYFPTIMRVYLLFGLFPLLYFAMTYMYRQRVKILGKGPSSKKNI